MMVGRAGLDAVLAGLRAGGVGAAGVYGTWLDRLPRLFGSAKLAAEADLILAALAAAEHAHAAAVAATAPVAFAPAGMDADGQPLYRPSATAPVGGLTGEWTGVSLYALALALGRARERHSVDDEVYSASFVYVLFRLKAALGVWRGDTTADAHYRLWLKDLAPVIADHPRLAPKVQDCHQLIAAAMLETCERYLLVLQTGERVETPPVFAAFAATAWQHATIIGTANQAMWETLGGTLEAAGLAIFHRGLSDQAAAFFSAQIALHGGKEPRSARACNILAGAYINRGNMLQHASRNMQTALANFDQAIAIRHTLQKDIKVRGAWKFSLDNLFPMEISNCLADAYMNRGNFKKELIDYGPVGALKDHNESVNIREKIVSLAKNNNFFHSAFFNDLAKSYYNRAVTKRQHGFYGAGEAIKDYNKSVEIRKMIRKIMEKHEAWNVELRNDLAGTYVNRGIANFYEKRFTAAIGDFNEAILLFKYLKNKQKHKNPRLYSELASAYMHRGMSQERIPAHNVDSETAISDYNIAITLLRTLKLILVPRQGWIPRLENFLAKAYTNRGNSKRRLARFGLKAAFADYSKAIAMREKLRDKLEPRGDWYPELRNDLAETYLLQREIQDVINN